MDKSLVQNWADNIERKTLYAIMAIGVVMLLVAWAHIFCRYVLNSSLTWSEEFLKLCLVWFCLLSSSILTKRHQHVGIVIFREKMPAKVQNVIVNFVEVLILVACGIVTVIGLTLVLKTYTQLTPALRISMAVCYSAIPVSFGLMFIFSIFYLIDKFFLAKKAALSNPQLISK